MAVGLGHMMKIIRDGMDAYWRAVHSTSDRGLSPTEIGWKRQHREDIARMEKKFGPEMDRIFKEK